MRTAIFLGLFSIARAIKGMSIFNDTDSMGLDSMVLSVFLAIFFTMDIIDVIKKLNQMGKE